MTPIDVDRLRDDLTGVLEGELLLDELSRALYATDASPFEVRPLCIVRPRHEADVQAVVDAAHTRFYELSAAGHGELGAIDSPVPRRHSAGGWSQHKLQHHRNEQIAHQYELA